MTAAIPALYSPEQVAARWGISEWWLRDNARKRTASFPFHMVAGKLKFTDRDIARILELTAGQARGELAQTPPTRTAVR